jgi:15-cis-phytoene synthase
MTATLAASYAHCRALHRSYGRTYYLATRLLPRWKRRHVHALYGFTRHTDEIVDRLDGDGPAERARRLDRWTAAFADALAGGPVGHPVLPAVLDTIARFDLDPADFAAFLHSMRMDLTVTEYPTYDDLLEYMHGSAAAIGSMMLPILTAGDAHGARRRGTVGDVAAREPARQLGLAFQLTNFIRDVSEDLARGRIYLPLKDLARFGVSPQDLRDQTVTPAIRQLIGFEIGRARDHYARAAAGIPLLAPSSRACIRTAHRLYGAILDEVVAADFDVFSRRARVSTPKRLAVVAASVLGRRP